MNGDMHPATPSVAAKDMFADALARHQAGRLVEAERLYRRVLQDDPNHADALHMLGVLAHQFGRDTMALDLIGQAIALNDGSAVFHCNFGLILRKEGRVDEAVASYRRALTLEQAYAEAHSNLGDALSEQGSSPEALSACKTALILRPAFAEALNNLATSLTLHGDLAGAATCFRRALVLRNDFVEVHANYSHNLLSRRELAAAIASYRRAVAVRPDHVGALVGFANALKIAGDHGAALATIVRGLRVKETGDATRIFVACLEDVMLHRDDREIRAFATRALTQPWDRPSKLAASASGLVKLDPLIRQAIGATGQGGPRPAPATAFAFDRLGEDPLLCALLVSTPVCDIELERFLTRARRAVLVLAADATPATGERASALRFCGSLARQCFINEYVFFHDEEEIAQARILVEAVTAALRTGEAIPPLRLAAIAAYIPLGTIADADQLLAREWPEDLTAVLVQQVSEPQEEVRLARAIARITPIEDSVSLLVKDQYEQNPYPRWVKTAPAGKPVHVVEYLAERFPAAPFSRGMRRQEIETLIAGCGTGQHSIDTFRRYRSGTCLAIDLSISSLGYAKRKSNELGLEKIEYAQADILKIGEIGREFDVIESSGVLHHLADPWSGWRGLLQILRPGGFMCLGFYSEIGRRHLLAERANIAKNGWQSTADGIRRYRHDLLNSPINKDSKNIMRFRDFSSISECRDLLFHVSESNTNLYEISSFIKENNLTFIGFEIDSSVLINYLYRFPDDKAAVDLAQWHMFEMEYPDTFKAMYQFWVQKKP